MSKKKKVKTNKKTVSMKEAFTKVSPKSNEKNVNQSKRRTMRDLFWEYPGSLVKVFKVTSPLSTIFLFMLLGFGVFALLRSNTFAENVTSKRYTQYVEGRIGAISTFNPLFSNQNDVDKAIQELVFEKLIYIDINGDITPGIATSWDISKDGKTYQFNISTDRMWSDGTLLTIDDVLFTFQTAIKLSVDHGYDTIGSALIDVEIERVDEDTIKFELPQTNATFPEIVSVYIIPKHILEDVVLSDMPFNIFSRNPVGSGPYRISRSEPNIVYLRSSTYYKHQPTISDIVVRIYSDVSKLQSAFRNGLLDGIVLPYNKDAEFTQEYPSYSSNVIDLPYRERILFFNLRKDKFQSEELRRGISHLIERDQLLTQSEVFGSVIYGPIFDGSWAYSSDANYLSYDVAKAITSLKNAGYTQNVQNGYFQTEDGKLLTLAISYLDNDMNTDLMNTLKELLDSEGVIINLEPFTYSQLTQEILATRNFEILMYEIELSIDPDQYNLWYSLQKEYPNLNLSGYEYDRVDILLEEGRGELKQIERKKTYALFQKYLVEDAPVIFLFRPSYLYVVRDNLDGINFENITRLEDIYKNVYDWEFMK
ncbi:TPA: hypothetical protein DEP90_02640 [Patescibacteria group bacterium]|nr:hypothetical protein [Patescibacteria group bacterium]